MVFNRVICLYMFFIVSLSSYNKNKMPQLNNKRYIITMVIFPKYFFGCLKKIHLTQYSTVAKK